MVSTKTCKLCKKEFETKAHNALYCPECRKEAKRLRRRKETTKEAPKNDLVKMAEQNVLNRVREAKDWIAIIGVLRVAGDTFFPRIDTDPIRKAWCDGLVMAENALYYVLCKYQADALIFTGVGGKEATQYGREKFRERFGLDGKKGYEVMSLLQEHLQLPNFYFTKDEIEFRRQAEQRYRDTEKD